MSEQEIEWPEPQPIETVPEGVCVLIYDSANKGWVADLIDRGGGRDEIHADYTLWLPYPPNPREPVKVSDIAGLQAFMGVSDDLEVIEGDALDPKVIQEIADLKHLDAIKAEDGDGNMYEVGTPTKRAVLVKTQTCPVIDKLIGSAEWLDDYILAEFRERSKVGIKKYGKTLARTDYNKAQWLTHLIQELMDAAGYEMAFGEDSQELLEMVEFRWHQRQQLIDDGMEWRV